MFVYNIPNNTAILLNRKVSFFFAHARLKYDLTLRTQTMTDNQ